MTPHPFPPDANRPDRPPVIILAGPTAVGKTALSLALATELQTDIVNADSMQVYRFMDIGTAKPSPEERARVPHHLIDVVNPDEDFDAARYLEYARPVVNACHGRGKIPLVVGGTGLYLKVLTRGICPGPPSDPAVRRALQDELESRGLEALHRRLLQVDPELGRRLHPHDRQRILRALEVFCASGTPLSQWQSRHRFRDTLYPSVKIALHRDREDLHRRIQRRVLQMMEQGFLQEVKDLLAQGYGPELKPMQSLGYRHLIRFLEGTVTLERAVEEIQRDTRRYAKRQFTWFRNDPEFRWFHPEDHPAVLRHVRAILSTLR